jgi:hypothetical protein
MYVDKCRHVTAHNRQLVFWRKFELSVLWKFRGELITFGHQTQPAFMREPLTDSVIEFPLSFSGRFFGLNYRACEFESDFLTS